MFTFNQVNFEKIISVFLKVDEIFIICDRNFNAVELVTSNNMDVINFLTKNKDIKDIPLYKKQELWGIIDGLSKDKTKYRSNSKYTIIKFKYYHNLYSETISNNKSIYGGAFTVYFNIKEIPEVIRLIRKEKIKKIRE